MLFSTTELKTESQQLLSEMEMVEELMRRSIAENARVVQDQRAYKRRFDELGENQKSLKHQYDDTKEQIASRVSRRAAMRQFVSILKLQDELVTEFDPTLWASCSTM